MTVKPCALCGKEPVENVHENRITLCESCTERAEKLERAEWKRRKEHVECDSKRCPGWGVMNDNEIQRCDTCKQYETDEDALKHVRRALLST